MWIGWMGGASVPENEQAMVTQRLMTEYSCVPVFLDDDLVDKYYNGFRQVFYAMFPAVSTATCVSIGGRDILLYCSTTTYPYITEIAIGCFMSTATTYCGRCSTTCPCLCTKLGTKRSLTAIYGRRINWRTSSLRRWFHRSTRYCLCPQVHAVFAGGA